MRLFSYESSDGIRVAACLEDAVVDVNRAYAAMTFSTGSSRADALAEAYVPPDMISILEGGDESLDAIKEALKYVKRAKKKYQ